MTASIAAGCGGTSPCTTESPATMGRQTRMSEVRVRRATVNAIGMSSTKPTSKKAGRPITSPPITMAHGTRFSPKKRISVLRNRVGAAGFRHHLAQHGSQRDHDGNVAQGAAQASFKGVNHCGQRHARSHANPNETRNRLRNGLSLETAISRISPITAISVRHQKKDAVRIDHVLRS